MADAEVICDISCGATHDGAVVRCSFMSTDYDIVPGERALMHCAMAALRLIGDQILLGFIMPFRVDTRTPVLAATAAVDERRRRAALKGACPCRRAPLVMSPSPRSGRPLLQRQPKLKAGATVDLRSASPERVFALLHL